MNPYKNMPARAFWRNGVVADSSLADIHIPKWPLDKSDCVVTMGSCFAQHVGKKLKTMGYNVPYFDDETGVKSRNFSANYGNIYTVRQALQLLRETGGAMERSETCWETQDGFVDPLRPNVFARPLASPDEVRANRETHLKAVREAVETLDVLVFTLGLTEAWEAVSCGSILPVVPGVLGGEFDPQKYAFHNFSYEEIAEDLEGFIEEVHTIRNGKPFRFLLTVSPVPLTATAENRHVLVSSVASKSILRSIADSFTKKHDFIDYFPSFEIITNPKTISDSYETNLRSVRQDAVDNVMDLFASAYDEAPPKPQERSSPSPHQSFESIGNVDCEDALLDQFGEKTEGTKQEKRILFFGDSHLGFLRNALPETIKEQSLFAPINFMENEPLKTIKEEKFQKFRFNQARFEDIESHNCSTVVVVGFGLAGDGILWNIGPLKHGYDGCKGEDISPRMPTSSQEIESLRQVFETRITGRLNLIKRIEQINAFQKIICVVSPAPPEKVARFRFGNEFVDSGRFNEIKELYADLFNDLSRKITPSVKFLRHDNADLYTPSGFVVDQYAMPNPWDVHPSAQFYKDGGIVDRLMNELNG